MTVASPFTLSRPPESDDELYWLIQAMWGVRIPRTPVCPDHIPPFVAFADAYFGRNSVDPDSPVQSVALWHGSRGLSGKSFMLSILGLTKSFMVGNDTNLLGGSMAQSTNIHEHMRAAMEYRNAPEYMVADNTATYIRLTNGARLRPLTASQRTVRGPHPALLLLDEIDEMELAILDAALGQPMPQKNYLDEIINPYTVMCVIGDTQVMTPVGEVAITEINPGDQVWTRQGWRSARQVIFNGLRPVVEVKLSNGRTLTCTDDHRIAVLGGKWLTPAEMRPGQMLSAINLSEFRTNELAVSSTGSTFSSATDCNEGVFSAIGMSRRTSDLSHIDSAWRSTAFNVNSSGDHFQVSGVAASQAGTTSSFNMVDFQIWKDGADQTDVGPAMHGASMDSTVHPSISTSFSAIPYPTPSFVNGRSTEEPVFVVSIVTRSLRHVPVYDLEVEDVHEFMAEGIIIHNCSTWQHPDKTFAEIYKRADEQGIPKYAWCYKETSNPVDGWLSEEAIAEKKAMIPAEMWRTEYDLGEPSIGNRAFDPDSVERVWNLPFAPIKQKVMKDFEEYKFSEYVRDGIYVIGADWAKEQDYTVIVVLRVDIEPYQLCYYARVNRRPYPVMIGMFNEAMAQFNAQGEYDRTGLGNVVNDYIDIRAHGFMMVGDKRASMLSEFVSGVETPGKMLFPKIPSAHLEMKYCQVGDLYSSAATQGFHLPDTVCALGLAYYRALRSVPTVSPITILKEGSQNRYQKIFEPRSGDVNNSLTGDVRLMGVDEDPKFSLVL